MASYTWKSEGVIGEVSVEQEVVEQKDIYSSNLDESDEVEYDYVSGFFEGLAVAWFDSDKEGYINEDGEIVIEFQFEDASVFSEGLAAVKVGDKWGYINKKGEIIIIIITSIKKEKY